MISAARGARKLALKDSQRFFEKELAQFRREYEEYRKKFFYDDKDFLEFMEKVNKVAMYQHQAPLTIAKQENLITELKLAVKGRDTELASLKDQLIKITSEKHRVDLRVTGLEEKLRTLQDLEPRLLQSREEIKLMHSRSILDRHSFEAQSYELEGLRTVRDELKSVQRAYEELSQNYEKLIREDGKLKDRVLSQDAKLSAMKNDFDKTKRHEQHLTLVQQTHQATVTALQTQIFAMKDELDKAKQVVEETKTEAARQIQSQIGRYILQEKEKKERFGWSIP